ncbi:hypothetical protein B0H19DRAFT_1243556 [Mycena capillaripes]|nr:hypothetical protein B0H19DRAFT_1243556 [Mycena capillaripes]
MQGVQSLWNIGIMLALPLTWMTWAVVSLVCCMVSLGCQYAIWVLHWSADSAPNSPAPKPLSMFQLSGFMIVILWSSFYVDSRYDGLRSTRIVIWHIHVPPLCFHTPSYPTSSTKDQLKPLSARSHS